MSCQTGQMRSKHFGFSTIINHNNGECKMQLPYSNIKTTNLRSQLLACNQSEAADEASVLQQQCSLGLEATHCQLIQSNLFLF